MLELENPKLVEALEHDDPEIEAENCPNPDVVDGKEKAEEETWAGEVLKLANKGVGCEEDNINGETCETGVGVKDTTDVVDRDDINGETCETDVWAKVETEVTADEDRFGLDKNPGEDNPSEEVFINSVWDWVLASGLGPKAATFGLL